MKKLIKLYLVLTLLHTVTYAQQQDILPPVLSWKGKSLELIAKKDNVWITPAEKNDFVNTPSYSETIAWLDNLCKHSDFMEMVSIGKSANGRDIFIVIASQDRIFDKTALSKSAKPLLLAQAGIHAGEIDGKDAGMMLLRDIAFGKKRDLLKNVNILFIPILNVDGHERASQYNRVNQRGPSNMGWRTNARNLNLNRDYTKLDSEEIRCVVQVMNEYNPTLYLDLHVTDGADYQYDITYGYSGISPSIVKWLDNTFKPATDQYLKTNGHIPGPLMFAANDRDFTEGNVEFAYSPRFSNNYGDLRRIPSILVENHSLKPFKQRVLGTYVFIESVLALLAKEGSALKNAIEADKALRNAESVLTYNQSEKPDTMTLLGVESKLMKSSLTGKDYIVWTGKPVTQKIPYIKNTKPGIVAKRPKAYWIPATHKDVISRLKLHGINVQEINAPRSIEVKMYRIRDYKFSLQPFEGHFTVSGSAVPETRQEVFYPGSVRIETNQTLGELAICLLEPSSPDSFLQWGFFPEIFTRTEYIEEYAIEPLARNMLANDPKLKAEFELQKQKDPAFINNTRAVYEWFYTRSPYVDNRYLLYPVGIEE
ncbi:M14 family metallopeptidase [Chryseosolibacter indicus]|uniref:Peptidase M14 domain-containing protein n=1 Tax=Chryseosolibacter indicus TaxID=2782351 RepID=A0ABS5VQC3_9BACT|nr:M14 family metallopeptidase [Chryseosolibacter indicus]MBT1702211.1 hypothetical protein [Chryseosolibacter indicus]